MSKYLKYKWAWIAWVAAFGVIEYKAIIDDDEEGGDFTFSHYVRRIMATFKTSGAPTIANYFARVIVTGIVSWLGPHFWNVFF